MDDRFLNEMRRDPDSKFAGELHAKLRAQGDVRSSWTLRPAPAFGIAFAAIAVASLFAFPAVRVSAQAMLDLFRVRKFSAIQFDESRLEKLRALKDGDQTSMVFDKPETVTEPGPPQVFSDPIAAGTAAGLDVRRAGYLPNGMSLDTVLVQGPGEARLTVREARLRALLDALDLRDVSLPMDLDGKVVDVKKPPVVIQKFDNGRWRAALIQCKSPEVSVPAGLDIERLAEIGLRVLGLDPGEARRVAQATDWRTTMVVPVPLNASTFRQVTIHGEPGLLITTTGRGATEGQHLRDGCVAMWTEGERVFAIVGNLGPGDTMEMAESVR